MSVLVLFTVEPGIGVPPQFPVVDQLRLVPELPFQVWLAAQTGSTTHRKTAKKATTARAERPPAISNKRLPAIRPLEALRHRWGASRCRSE
jgi:hypothetical protein